MQWDFGHSGNLQNLQGNCLQCNLFRNAKKNSQFLFTFVKGYKFAKLFISIQNCKKNMDFWDFTFLL